MFRKTIFLILYLFVCLYTNANNRSIHKLTYENGLSHDYIKSITQDHEGFVWIATEWGLNRFDGSKFKVYWGEKDNKNTISHNAINKILSDPDTCIIWIATQRTGLNSYNTITQEFVHFPILENVPNATRANGITDLCVASDGNIWIAAYDNGIKKLHKDKNTITDLDTKLYQQTAIRCLVDDGNNTLYVGHNSEGFSVISLTDNTTKHFKHEPNNPHSLPNNNILCIYIDSKKNIWIGTNNGLAIYQPDSETFTVFKNDIGNANSISDNSIFSIYETTENTLYIGTNKGLNILDIRQIYVYQTDKVKFQQIEANDLTNGLSHPTVSSIFKDSFGNTWLGTYGGGLNIITHQQDFFNLISYSPIKGEANSLSSKTVITLHYDQEKNLWVGQESGEIDVFKDGIKIKSYNKKNNKGIDNTLLSSICDSKGNIWFGTNSKGLIRYNPQKDNFENIKIVDYNISNIKCLYEDRNNNLWIGADQGVFIYNLNSQEIKQIGGTRYALTHNLIRSITQDNNDNIWIGTLINGIVVLGPDLKVLKTFNMANGFISNGINYLYTDNNNNIWAASIDGLGIYNSKTKEWKFITQENSDIPDNNIRAIIEGKPNQFWLSTSRGLFSYDIPQHKVSKYNNSGTILSSTFMDGAVTRNIEGEIYFGSQNGVCHFNSNKSPSALRIPTVAITSFDVYDETKQLQISNLVNKPIKDNIKLRYTENSFTIGVNVIDYALQDQVEYSCILTGLNDAWFLVNEPNLVTFRNLLPGKYTFKVRARIHNQAWSNQETTFSIYIAPPFWLSYWAKAFYCFASLLIIILILRFYKRRTELENQLYLEQETHQKKQELHDEGLRFYTNIAHELRTPLTLILGPLEDLLSDSNLNIGYTRKISLIHKSAARLANLTNQLLEFRKSETKNRDLCVSFENIGFLIQETALKYKELNQKKDVNIEVVIETENTTLYYDTEVVTIILDNLISNALKYTIEGTVSIILRTILFKDKPYLEIEIKDTGVGIPQTDLDKIFDRYYQVKGKHQAFGTGIGLALVKNMIKLHEGEIEVKSRINHGTSFFVRLQLENQYPNNTHIETEELTQEESTGTKPVLLIIEDNEDIRTYIAESFAEDFNVLTAENGKIGTEIAFEKLPDIIISDIMMPEMDGFQLTKILKQDVRTSHILIILLTAKDSLQDKTDGYLSGADSYITKPFSAKLLRIRVQNLLEAREKVKGLFSSKAPLEASANSLSKIDNEFIDKIIKIIEDNLDSEQLNISYLADQVYMSHVTFYRKIKALTGLTASEFIRRIKMQHAERMLLSRQYTVTEIAYKTGFNNLVSFRQAFKTEFNLSPSDYLKKVSTNE